MDNSFRNMHAYTHTHKVHTVLQNVGFTALLQSTYINLHIKSCLPFMIRLLLLSEAKDYVRISSHY